MRQRLTSLLPILLALFLPSHSAAQARAALSVPVLDPAQSSILPISQPLPHLTLQLKRTSTQQAALDAFLSAAQQPGSSNFRKWLTPAEFAARFAPTPDRVEAVREWLTTEGFQIESTSPNGMRIDLSGTAQQVNHAFAVTLRSYSQGSLLKVAPDRGATVPSELGDAVSDLTGLALFHTAATDNSSTLEEAIDSNTQPIVFLPVDASAAELTPLLEQAAAQGITVLVTGSRPGFLASSDSLARTALLVTPAAAGDADIPSSSTGAAARPTWQFAPGLPQDNLRAAPDATVADIRALSSALQSFVARRSERLGELAPALYRLSTGHGIFTHSDTTLAPGTWTSTDGLGTIDVAALIKALDTGTTGGNVSLTPSANTVVHGKTLTLTFAVTGASGTPTGTVTATLKGRTNLTTTTLGPVTLSTTGGATLSTSALAGDIYDLTGAYSGDTTYAANTSNASAITVTPEVATITATVPTAAAAVGGTVPVTITVSSASGVGTPSGPVTVYAYGTSVATTAYTATLSSATAGTASAVVSVPATDAGTFTFQGNCTTGASFSCGTPQSVAVTVGKGTPLVTLTSTAATTTATTTATTSSAESHLDSRARRAVSATSPYTLVATVAAPTGSTSASTPSGTVQVLDNGTAIASFAIAKGTGTYTAPLTSAAHSLVAVYSGDTNYLTADSTAVTTASTLVATTTSLAAGATTGSYGTGVTLTASVTPASYTALGAPTGTITFTDSVQGVIGTATLANGYVTYSAKTLLAGSHSITATYTTDNTSYASSAASTAVTVTIATVKATTSTVVSVSPNPPFANQLSTVTATVTATSLTGATVPPAFTGTVSFFSNGVYLAQGTISGSTATAQVRLAPGAALSLTAAYNGDTNYYGSTSAALAVTPVQVTSAITLSTNISMPEAGSSIVLTANVTAASLAVTTPPTGTVTFYSTRNGVMNTLGTATLSANGTTASVANFIATGLTAGLYSITAVYNGDTTFTTATSAAVGVQFGDFSVSFSPSSVTLSRGATAAVSAILSVNNGFSGAVVFGCTPPAGSNISCSFSPTSLAGSGQATLNINVSATSSSAQPGRPAVTRLLRPHSVAAGAAIAGLFGLLLPRRRIRSWAALLLLLCSVTLVSGGCSAGIVGSTNNTDGGSSTPINGGGSGTTGAGTYGTFLLTVTAVSSDNTVRHTYSYPVTVQ